MTAWARDEALPGEKSTEDLAARLPWKETEPAFVLVILSSVSRTMVGYSVEEVWLVGPVWLILIPYLLQVPCLS